MSESLNAHIRHGAISNGVMNTLCNGAAAWFLLKAGENLTLRGNIIGDLMATAAILLFIVAWILIPLNRCTVTRGKVVTHDWDSNNAMHRLLQRMPNSLFVSALLFALFGLIVIAPLTALALWIVGATELSPLAYSIFKGIWAGLMAAAMTVPMVLLATAQSEQA